MISRKIVTLFVLFCLCFHLMPYQAMAASTSDAVEPIIPEKECSLTVSYCYGEKAFSGMEVRLYRIAEVSADFEYTLTPTFTNSGMILDGIRTVGEWNVVRSTLEAYVIANSLSPEFTVLTDENGEAAFDNMKTGIYLALQCQAEDEDMQYLFDSALITLPGLGVDGRWQYQTAVNAKGEALPPIDSDEEAELKVIKLWRGDENQSVRPKSVEVEIFCNGESRETVILSDETNWSYTWSAKDDGSRWTVVERNVSDGYTMTVEERQSTFVITNTWVPTTPDIPDDPPGMGDTSSMLLYAIIMVCSGTLFIIVGVTRKRSAL